MIHTRDGGAHWRGVLLPLLAIGLGGALLAAPQNAAQGFEQGLRLCLHSVLPALFPFFVVCELLAGSPLAPLLGRPLRPLTRAWGLPGEAAPLVLVLSWLGGYAVCARLTARLCAQKQLTSAEAERLLLLGCCAGPGFVIGCLGGLLLASPQVGILLYGLQLAANLLATACLLPFLPVSETLSAPAAVTMQRTSLPAAISSAVDSSLQVCGCTVFFCILSRLLRTLFPLSALWVPFLDAALEVSTGCAAFASLGGRWALYGLCLCLSLPGLSVFCQITSLLDGRVPLRHLPAARLLHLIWLQLLMRLCARFLPGVDAVFSTLSARVVPMNRLPPDAALLCFIFICCALYKLRQTFYNRQR